jgi:hypothetical protein
VNYDSNLCSSGRMAQQTIELTFQVGEFTVTKTTTLGGNCLGFAVIESAVENLKSELGDSTLELKHNGDTMLVELWEFDLLELLTGARITAIEPEKEKE